MEKEFLDVGVRFIKGVGEAREKMMSKLGVSTVRELISFFPRAYEDRTLFKEINGLTPGETVCVSAMAATAPRLTHIRKGLDLVKLRVADDTGAMDVTFFNQSFIKDAIKQGETYVFFGKVSGTFTMPEMTNPLFERDGRPGAAGTMGGSGVPGGPGTSDAPGRSAGPGALTGRIMPVYALTAGLSQKIVSSAVRLCLEKCGDELPDVLPENIVRRNELCRARYAYANVHFPEDFHALDIARQRLIFEELFVFSAAMKVLRYRRGGKSGKRIERPDFGEFYNALSFELTGAQKRAIEEAAGDMAPDDGQAAIRPMNRLVQGDVGSGKTMVAAASCWMVWRSGYQTAYMAPTEILANQHYRSLSKLLEPMGMKVGLLTGSQTAKTKRGIYEQLSLGQIDLIIGTHALISEGVNFSNLGLVITDEQHRFGVSQRSMLTDKGDSPHVLVMSATPIPRTLALIIYGDLDVSVIDEMPPGRRAIETFVVGEKHRRRIYNFIEKLVGEGRQVYIICPMVDEESASKQEETDSSLPGYDNGSPQDARTGATLKAVVEYHTQLQNDIFPHLRTALVHGKLSGKEKDAVMTAFAAGQIDVLVATTVIEVGVDVPNAALMVVENADRFGLSQLHQLRGRVGRGQYESYCVLFRGAGGEVSRERLEIMRTTNDGFKIAEEDLKLRGPGDFLGSRQHGLPEMKIANLAADMLMLSKTQTEAEELLRSDPELEKPENRKLAEQIKRVIEISAGTLN